MVLIPRLRSKFPELAPTEQAVARLLLSAPEAVVKASIREVADRAEVSTAAVTRLSRKLGFRDFRELKIALAMELGGRASLPPPWTCAPRIPLRRFCARSSAPRFRPWRRPFPPWRQHPLPRPWSSS